MASTTARRYVQFLNPVAVEVVITSPVDGAEVVTDGFTVTWQHTAQQTQYRLQVYSDEDLTTLVYDSQWTVSAVLSGAIPAGALDSGSTYWIKVTVATDSGQGVSEAVSVLIRLPAATAFTGLALRAVGGDCGDLKDPRVLPGIRLTWNEITPGAGETFVRYAIWRRKPPETAWMLIAVQTTVTTTTYTDYGPESREVYEYAVTYEATIASGETLYSARQSPPPNGRLIFDFIWIHSALDPALHARVFAHMGSVQVSQSMSFGSTWGRERPTAYVGEFVGRSVRLSQLDMLRRHPQEWRKFEELMLAQQAGAVLLLRMGRDRERYYVAWPQAVKSLAQKSYTASVELTEVHYEEAVT